MTLQKTCKGNYLQRKWWSKVTDYGLRIAQPAGLPDYELRLRTNLPSTSQLGELRGVGLGEPIGTQGWGTNGGCGSIATPSEIG